MISSLILVISAVLVGQSVATSVPDEVSLIKHPAPVEKLDGSQLIKQLSVKDLNIVHKGRVAEYVAEQLYATKDKATTEVFEELTVQSLIDLNQVALTSCSSITLNKRHDKFDEIYELEHKKRSFDLVFGIVVYMATVNLKTFEYCTKNREQVVSQGIATNAELEELFHKLVYPPNERDYDEYGDPFAPETIEKSGLIHAVDLQAPYTGSLIKHPVKCGKLNKDQLVAKLSLPKLRKQHKGRVAEYVAEQLYSAKDKATTEVLEGVTVQSLIEMNTASLARCRKDAMDRMNDKLDKMSDMNLKGEKFELVFGIFVFAMQAEIMVSEYCRAHRNLVISNYYADDEHMDTFVERLMGDQKDGDIYSDDDDSDDDEYYDDSDDDEDEGDDEIDFEDRYEMGSLTLTTTKSVEEDVAALVGELFNLHDYSASFLSWI